MRSVHGKKRLLRSSKIQGWLVCKRLNEYRHFALVYLINCTRYGRLNLQSNTSPQLYLKRLKASTASWLDRRTLRRLYLRNNVSMHNYDNWSRLYRLRRVEWQTILHVRFQSLPPVRPVSYCVPERNIAASIIVLLIKNYSTGIIELVLCC